jgi:hypothetical protein
MTPLTIMSRAVQYLWAHPSDGTDRFPSTEDTAKAVLAALSDDGWTVVRTSVLIDYDHVAEAMNAVLAENRHLAAENRRLEREAGRRA